MLLQVQQRVHKHKLRIAFVNYRDVANKCYRRCFNYIFILDFTAAFIGLGKDNRKTKWETYKFSNLLCLILEVILFILRVPLPYLYWTKQGHHNVRKCLCTKLFYAINKRSAWRWFQTNEKFEFLLLLIIFVNGFVYDTWFKNKIVRIKHE